MRLTTVSKPPKFPLEYGIMSLWYGFPLCSCCAMMGTELFIYLFIYLGQVWSSRSTFQPIWHIFLLQHTRLRWSADQQALQKADNEPDHLIESDVLEMGNTFTTGRIGALEDRIWTTLLLRQFEYFNVRSPQMAAYTCNFMGSLVVHRIYSFSDILRSIFVSHPFYFTVDFGQ